MRICILMLMLNGTASFPEFRVFSCRECWELASAYSALGFGVRSECFR